MTLNRYAHSLRTGTGQPLASWGGALTRQDG